MNMSFGERKIQKSNYSFLCPLPATWAKSMKLDQGSKVNVEMLEDNSLKLTPVSQALQDSEKTEVPVKA